MTLDLTKTETARILRNRGFPKRRTTNEEAR